MAPKMRTGVRLVVSKLRSDVETILIEAGLKKEPEEVILERVSAAEKRRKKDFDSVYRCINNLSNPDQVKSVENLISNFNRTYGEFNSGQYLPASESYILNIALNIKSSEVYSGVYAEWAEEERERGEANIKALKSASSEEYYSALSNGVQMSSVVKRAYSDKYPTPLECLK